MKRDELLTVAQVLDELGGVSRRTFYRWREIGKAPKGFRLPNGELRIYRSDLETWLESLRSAA
ncbi:AlpA family transcriptional regulator [Nonomuraea sp. NEAU-A123]|uniref:helix-turn-helix transcriptional regulator n=1 Tax=Nonomuraea sp. NEAU-A123 TaxID=2839649 RepID=UPI001BE46596|nr:helix-turn-helix domain-containing protein [Nonomuraea sp. NEAU-A123]MBT2231685.1 helix-turn-helix domain-containing protein [Nonomuraea sp. NEAU-A123]